jgi:hypothetical protein
MTENRRSQVVEFLEQQKYDEVLPILGGLREKDPADRELQIYHLLVVRILILRWNLTSATAKRVFFLRTKIQRIITSAISLTRATFETHVIPLPGRIYPAIVTWVVLRGLKSIIIVGAGIGLFLGILLFHRLEGSPVTAPAPAKMVTAILGLDSTVSASDTVPYVLDNSRTAEQGSRRTPEFANASGVDSLRISQPSTELPPTRQLTYGTEPKAAVPAPKSAKAITYRRASDESAGGRQVKQTVPIKNVIEPTDIENNRNKSPRMILGHYRSRQAIPIRTAPQFAAPTVREMDSGVPLNVLAYVDSWAEVELNSSGITGFVRKEFLIPVGEDKSHVARSTPSVRAISEVTDSTLVSRSE